MDAETVLATYRSQRLIFERYCRKLEDLLRELLASRNVKSHIESRAKTVKSFHEKITRPGKKYVDPLKEMTDLAAVRIICYNNDAVDIVREIISSYFEVDEANSVDKRHAKDADRFGYSSVHLIVRPTSGRGALPEWSKYCGIPAEIQIRTVLAHAWATLSHAAQYKRETEAPISLARRLARLAALLEVADEEVKNLSRIHEAVTARALNRANTLDFDMTPDIVTLKVYLQSAAVLERLVKLSGQAVSVNSFGSLAQLFHLVAGIRIDTLQRLDEELEMAAADDGRLRRFFSDDRVKAFMNDRSQIALFALIMRNMQKLDPGWLEKRLNWQKEFIESITAAIAETSGSFHEVL